LAFAGLIVANGLGQDSQSQSDEKVTWLKENAVEVRSIDPADHDFADLMPLVDLIGDARVVGLGEPSHGDGAHFHAKTRLIAFLHKVMGFDVLVWESGMYSCHLVEQAIREGEPVKEAWRKGVFGIWGASEQVQPLFGYIQTTRDTENPLEIAGCDSQMTGRETPEALRTHLRDFYEQAGSPEGLADEIEVFNSFFDLAKIPPLPKYTDFDFETLNAAAETIMSELRDDEGAFVKIPRRERAFFAQALSNFCAMSEMVYWMSKSQSPDAEEGDMLKYANVREPQFADTLIWLAQEHYSDRKLIVWAASSHLTYNSGNVEQQKGDDGAWEYDDMKWEPMGNRVKQALGDEFYVIDFIAYDGEIGSIAGWSRPLDAAENGTIDALCHETGSPFLFVDLRNLPKREGGAWLAERQIARPRGYGPMRANWPEVCDAFFFTDVMYPSTRVAPQEDE
ncbi:MAG: erythromycin esterase family protein, partial [Planctomycetota bacterium]|nr:erythromycin esterase family protein [Planctomycetota bacterium]